MANNNEDKFRYTIGDVNELIEERGNMVTMLRKLAWGDHDEKLELRRWIVDIDSEKANKGVTFMTEEGPNNLTEVMTRLGYGDTETLIKELSEREDFDEALVNVIGVKKVETAKKETSAKPTFYDPKQVLCA